MKSDIEEIMVLGLVGLMLIPLPILALGSVVVDVIKAWKG